MRKDNSEDSSPTNKAINIDKIIENYEPYIRTLVRNVINRYASSPQSLDMDVDDLTQKVLFKLWRALKRVAIRNIGAFSRTIVENEVIDTLRSYRATIQLPDDEELTLDSVSHIPGKGIQDPAYEVEHKEGTTECIKKIANAIINLPPTQQYAVVCCLKEKPDDTFQLLDELMKHGIPVETINWPEEQKDKIRLRASLSFARKKLRHLKKFQCA